jgi:hypothetical protein
MKSIRTKIRENVATIIQGITIAGGYNNDWGSVNQTNPALTTYPCASVYVGAEDPAADVNTSFSDSYQPTAKLAIVLDVKVTKPTSPTDFSSDSIIDEAIDDIKRAIGRNPSLNGAGTLPPLFAGVEEPAPYSTGSMFVIKRTKILWDVPYVQSRLEPSQQP